MKHTWNHRVFFTVYPDGGKSYSIREAYYDGNGDIEMWTDWAEPAEESLADLKETLHLMLKACDEPVLAEHELSSGYHNK